MDKMSYKDALWHTEDSGMLFDESRDVCKRWEITVKEALSLQIEKPAIQNGQDICCPRCGSVITRIDNQFLLANVNHDHCRHCGQALSYERLKSQS